MREAGGIAATDVPSNPPSAWILTDGKIGDLVHCRGVAEAMGLDAREITLSPRAPWRWFAPRGSGDPKERARVLRPPYPDIAIASGRRAVPYLRALKRASADHTFAICLKDPRAGTSVADFIWVPEHDPLRGDNVLATLTSPHTLSESRVANERAALPDDIVALPSPRITVLLGGPSGRNRFSDANVAALAENLTALGRDAGAFLLTPSRRTPQELVDAAQSALEATGRPLRVWDGSGDNPYLSWMAAADALVVTGDSVNMVGEAAAMGRPVFVHRPDALSGKIETFLDRMEARGHVAPFDGHLVAGPFAPLDATPHIAAEAARRYAAHRAVQTNRGRDVRDP